jgi:hypothetical protein
MRTTKYEQPADLANKKSATDPGLLPSKLPAFYDCREIHVSPSQFPGSSGFNRQPRGPGSGAARTAR